MQLVSVKEICRQIRIYARDAYPVALDESNDFWLDSRGLVSARNAPCHYIGDVSALRGSARVIKARGIVAGWQA